MPAIDRRLRLFVELAVVIALDRLINPLATAAASALHVPLPQMPLLEHAYLFALLSALVLAYVVWRREDLAAFGIVPPARPWVLIGRGLLVFAVVMAYEIGVTPILDPIVTKATGTSATLGAQHFAAVRGNLGLFLYLIPFTWIFGALGEEFLNRGFLLTRIAQLLGEGRAAWVAAAILQGIVFGLGHGYQGPVGMIGAGMIGIIYAAGTLVWGRNLWPAIVAHGVFDCFAFFMVYVGIIHA